MTTGYDLRNDINFTNLSNLEMLGLLELEAGEADLIEDEVGGVSDFLANLARAAGGVVSKSSGSAWARGTAGGLDVAADVLNPKPATPPPAFPPVSEGPSVGKVVLIGLGVLAAIVVGVLAAKR